MRCRRAVVQDLDAVAALVNGAYRGEGARLGWTHEADLLSGQRTDRHALLATLEKGAVLLVGEDEEGDGAPVASVMIEAGMTEAGIIEGGPVEAGPVGAGMNGGGPVEGGAGRPGRVRHLGMLTVRPDRQASGIGRALLEAAEREAARLGAHRVRLTVISVRAELIAWYRRRGYDAVGRAPFPHDDPSVGEARRRDLEFVVLEKRLGPAGA